jgi:hypothetical protein
VFDVGGHGQGRCRGVVSEAGGAGYRTSKTSPRRAGLRNRESSGGSGGDVALWEVRRARGKWAGLGRTVLEVCEGKAQVWVARDWRIMSGCEGLRRVLEVTRGLGTHRVGFTSAGRRVVRSGREVEGKAG